MFTCAVRRWLCIADSKWIYANRYEQILHSVGKGKLQLLPEVRDIHDVTIRMHAALMTADVVLCEDYDRTANLLYSLSHKLGHIEPRPNEHAVVKVETPSGFIASDEMVQLSEHLKFKKEHSKTAGEQLDVNQLIREQAYIRQYNLKQSFRERINSHKQKNGFGYVISLEKEPQLKLKEYIEEGFNLSFMYDEGGHHLKNILLQAEQAKIPYEILPGPSELVSALSASGFPADRFGTEYFPCSQGPEFLQSLLEKRKEQNFSIAIMDKRSNLELLLRRISVVFGEAQLVYIVRGLDTIRRQLRLSVSECLNSLEKEPIPSKQELQQRCTIIVAPYAMDYNVELKERLFQRSQTIDDLNEDEEMTTKKLLTLEQKLKSLEEPQRLKIHGVEAAQYLLSVVANEEETTELIRKLLRIGDRDARQIVSTAKAKGSDILQIEHDQLKRKKKK